MSLTLNKQIKGKQKIIGPLNIAYFMHRKFLVFETPQSLYPVFDFVLSDTMAPRWRLIYIKASVSLN